VKGYDVYCLADPLFFDSPAVRASEELRFESARRSVPEGWKRNQLDDWLVHMPEGVELPAQGWKIHASACLDNAEQVVRAVWDYCLPRRIPFKFVPGRGLFHMRNLKYASRGSSGKLVTIYTISEEQLETVLHELSKRLAGQPGPYILSDLRFGQGPLYVRYGGFAERYCIGPSGEQELAIANADGELVPDRRGPTFQLPDWITLPAFLEPHLAARNSVKVDELPCTVEQALHFSNSGGVYLGTDKQTGDRVVLKEARPYAGVAMDGADAVARLERERENLERLAGIESVPALRDYRVLGEHHFLVQNYFDGKSLHSCLAERSPLVYRDVDPSAVDEYAEWAMRVCRRIEDAVAKVHERGLAVMDLHPANVLVRRDDRVALIDLEMASDVSKGTTQTLADPAFLAPRGTSGLDVDRHALGCLRLYVFLPLTALFNLDRAKPLQLAEEIAKLVPTAGAFVQEGARMVLGTPPAGGSSRADPVPTNGRPSANGDFRSNGRPRSKRTGTPLRPPLEPTAEGWRRARDSMAAAILASATPARDDRLFPGDIGQFASGGLNIAVGAAGVLYALHLTGAGRYPEHEDWLIRGAVDPKAGTRLGFYDGLHGIAFVLDFLGRRQEALVVLERCLEELRGKYAHFGLDLSGGLAGIGLNLLHFARATGDAALWDSAHEVVEKIAERLGAEDGVPTISGGKHPYAGLIRGSSGPALLFMRMYDQTLDESLLELAETALRQDLRRCINRPGDGALHINEGWRHCPYIGDGSVGIGFALQDYLARRENESFEAALASIPKTAGAPLFIGSGLFFGRAGMILFLSRQHPPGTAAARDPVVAEQVRRLAWHALAYKGHLAFPGEHLLRLSMDLTTGTAGVLLGMGAALHSQAVYLPFLEPDAREVERGVKLAGSSLSTPPNDERR
jgi:tRNA A-37 threonylcarbamoyl transferase component Bud32